MKSHFPLNKVAASLAVIGGVSLFSTQGMAAVTPMAGTNISNVATATYTDSTGTERVVTSNEVKTIVAQVGSFTLEANRTAQTTPNGQVTLPHILTNTGNGTDKFTVSLANLADDDFDFASGKYAVYLDRNKDGVPDDATDLNGKSIELQAGESVGLVIVATTPSTVKSDTSANLEIKATSLNNQIYVGNAVSQVNKDTVTITSGAVIQITKAASVSTAKIGDTITYTLTFKNTGNAVAKKVAIFDVLPETVEFVSGSAKFNGSSTGLTDAEDTIDTFASNGKAILFNIESIEPNTTGKLTFSVKVKDSTNVGNIQNTAFVDPNGNVEDPENPKFLELKDLPENPNEKPKDPNAVPSNPSIVTVIGTYNGSLNDSSTINTPTGKDDKITLEGKQGLPVIFGGQKAADGDKVVVHNNGNSIDTYNLTYDKSALPTGSIVEILKIDGNTPAVDTNGDGIVDTGPIEAGKNQEFVVRVTLPNGTILTKEATVILTSTSINNNQADSMDLIISSLSKNSVDLVSKVDSREEGKGNHTEESYKTPFNDGVVDQKTTPPGTPTVFDITIKNDGNIPDNYNINVPTVPEGWTVEIFEKNGDSCTSTKVSNSGNIKNGEQKSFCVTVTPPAGTPAGEEKKIDVVINSPSTGTSDEIKFNVIVDDARGLSLTPDRQGQVAPGGTIVYQHVLKNIGNTTEGASTANPLNLEWTSTLKNGNTSVYIDVNQDGKLDSNELVQFTTNTDGGVTKYVVDQKQLNALLDLAINRKDNDPLDFTKPGLQPGETLNIFVKVEAPASATAGEADTTIVTFKPTGNKQPNNVSITDRTVVTLGQVRLVKTQAVSKDCIKPSGVDAYTTNTFTAKPGECVYYNISAVNEGNALVSNIVIADIVPSYTTLMTNSVEGTVKPDVVDRNFIKKIKNTGSEVGYGVSYLAPSSTATLQFGVKIDGKDEESSKP